MARGPEGESFSPEAEGQLFGSDAESQFTNQTTDTPEAGDHSIWTRAREAVGGAWQNIGETLRDRREKTQINRQQAAAQERRIKGYAEIMKHGPKTPQELQDMMAELSFQDLKVAEERVEYGPGALGKLKAFLAGERDFRVSQDGEIENCDVLVEAGRRLVSTFANRRTLTSAGMYLAMGLFTGGFGFAAGGVLWGGIAGRGLAEMSELFSGKTRDVRERIVYAEKARWEEMRTLAQAIREKADDPVEQANLTRQLVDLAYRQGESVQLRNLVSHEQELAKREEQFNKLRNRLQTVGELTGAAVGLTSILNGGVEHLDIDGFSKLNGQSIFHGVQQSQHGWKFLYSSGAEAGRALHGATILPAGHFGAHALNATTAQVLGYTFGERTFPMLLASGVAWAHEKLRSNIPDRYWQDLPDGKRVFYTREDNGSYKFWQLQEVEKEVGGKKVKEYQWASTDVAQKDVPAAFRERYRDYIAESRTGVAERVHSQIPSTIEYIRSLADQLHNPIPENPRGYTYNWNEQPRVLDDRERAVIDQWYRVDTTTSKAAMAGNGILNIAVLGVDVENNRIAYARSEKLPNGAQHFPVEVIRLDTFLKEFRLHYDASPGRSTSSPSNESESLNSHAGADNRVEPGNNPDEPTEPDDDNNPPEPEPPTPAPTDPSPRPPKVDPPKKVSRMGESQRNDLEEELLRGFEDGSTKPTPPTPPTPESKSTKPVEVAAYRDIVLQQLNEPKTSPKIAGWPLLTEDRKIYQEFFDQYAEDWMSLSDAQKREAKLGFDGRQNPKRSDVYQDHIRVNNPDGSTDIVKFETRNDGAIRLSLGRKKANGETEWNNQPIVGQVLDLLRTTKQRLENIDRAAAEENDQATTENPVDQLSQKKRSRKVKVDVRQDDESDRLAPGMKRQKVKENSATEDDGAVGEATNGQIEEAKTASEADASSQRSGFPIGERAKGLLEIAARVKADQEKRHTGQSAKTEDTTPEPQPIQEKEKVREITKGSDLQGKLIQLDNPIQFVTANPDVVFSGELNPDDVTSDTFFTVEEANDDLVEFRLNGGRITAEAEDLLPHIVEVKDQPA